MKLSVVIPAFNEEENIRACICELRECLGDRHEIPCEIIVVNDNSTDRTAEVVRSMAEDDPEIRLVDRRPPGGFGRAVRAGFEAVTGDIVVVYMADLSDDPEDVVRYYRKIRYEGYDCVFGSRFVKGAIVENYPRMKLITNRIVNKIMQIMFWCRFNDLTNAFKAYRTTVISECGPFRSSHFNITIEMSLSALIRDYSIAQIPINWYGRTWGSSNLRMREMSRRYLSTLLKVWAESTFVRDDLIAERLANDAQENADGARPKERHGLKEDADSSDSSVQMPSKASPETPAAIDEKAE